MTNQETYNGWSNFETWQAALWLDNDGVINWLREDGNLTVEAITDELENQIKLYETPASLLQDLVGAWLERVNVREIVENNK
jgi:hypothetical protein